MGYCLLKEVYPNYNEIKNNNEMENNESTKVGMTRGGWVDTNSSINKVESVSNNKSFAKFDENNIIPDDIDDILQHEIFNDKTHSFEDTDRHLPESVFIHISQCSKCQNKLKGIIPNKIVRNVVSPFDQIIELSTFILTGIFIILALDILMKKK